MRPVGAKKRDTLLLLMQTLFDLGLKNAILVTALALVVAGAAFFCRRRPALVHTLWILVLLKFLVPPVYPIEIPLSWKWEASATTTEISPSAEAEPLAQADSHLTARPSSLTGKPTQVAGGLLGKGGNEREVVDSIPAEKLEPTLPLTVEAPAIFRNPEVATSDPPIVHGRVTGAERSDAPAAGDRGFEDSAPATRGEHSSGEPSRNTGAARLAAPSWQAVIGGIWISGSLAWLAVAGVRIFRFQNMLRYAKPADVGERNSFRSIKKENGMNSVLRRGLVDEQARILAKRLGLRRCPEILFVPAPVSPMVWALGRRARLLIPSALWGRLTEEQRQTLLIHELAHLRRGDHWVRRLELVVTALYWWDPVVWWAQQQLRQAEEQCCDAWVVWALPAAGQTYATTLVETLAFLSKAQPALPLGASGIEHVQQLKRRLAMIMTGTSPRAMSRAGFWVVLGFGILLLPLVPISARPQPTDQDQDKVSDQQPQQGGEEEDQQPQPPHAKKPMSPPTRGQPARPPVPQDWSEQLEAARDEVELLLYQMAIKQAEVGEAETQIKSSQRSWARLKELHNKGAVSIEDFSQAQSDLDLRKAQLETRRAQLQEVEVRYQQATRRLERLTQRQKEEGSKERRKGGGGEAAPGTPLPRAAGQTLPSTRVLGGPGGGVGAAGGPVLRPGAPGGPGAGLPRGPGEAGVGGAMGPGGPPGALAGPAGGGSAHGAPGMMGDGPGGRMGTMGGGGQAGMMRDMMGMPISASWASDLFEDKSWDFGTVRRGERLTHSFRLTNDLNRMVQIKDVRVSAGFITARANGKQLAPGASATINVQIDTHRFSGDKTSNIYVLFDRPDQATVQLQVQADSRDNAMGMMSGMSMPQKDSQAKIVELEKKVDMLIEQMDGLRNELAKQRVNKPSKEIRK